MGDNPILEQLPSISMRAIALVLPSPTISAPHFKQHILQKAPCWKHIAVECGNICKYRMKYIQPKIPKTKHWSQFSVYCEQLQLIK